MYKLVLILSEKTPRIVIMTIWFAISRFLSQLYLQTDIFFA